MTVKCMRGSRVEVRGPDPLGKFKLNTWKFTQCNDTENRPSTPSSRQKKIYPSNPLPRELIGSAHEMHRNGLGKPGYITILKKKRLM